MALTIPVVSTSGAKSTVNLSAPVVNATTTAVNRPANPAITVFGSALTNPSAWAKPGSLVLTGRDNYAHQSFKTIATGGGCVMVYLDPIVRNAGGRYHDKLFNSSEFGATVPNWPGSPVANSTGPLADFRVGGILQSKLAGVINLMLDENPHLAGVFLDDVGSRSWFPNFSWTSIDREAYRAGAIAVCQTMHNVALARDLFVMVNGTWGGASSTGGGDGGYPDRTKSGLSLVDGGCVENHSSTSELSYWTGYATSAQWGAATPRKMPYMWFDNHNGNVTDRNGWVAANVAAFASSTTSSDSTATPWKSFTDFGLPRSRP